MRNPEAPDHDTLVSDAEREGLVEQVGSAMVGLRIAIDAVDELAAERLGVNRSDLRCLDILIRCGPMTAGALAAESNLTPGTVTSLIDRLERAGYARRLRDKADRRRVLVTLTDQALRRADEVYGAAAAAGRERVESYDRSQLATILDFLSGERDVQIEYARRLRDAEPRDDDENS